MKQSIISIGMTACCLSGNGQFLFAADKQQADQPDRGPFRIKKCGTADHK